jgi:hypothetical protein
VISYSSAKHKLRMVKVMFRWGMWERRGGGMTSGDQQIGQQGAHGGLQQSNSSICEFFSFDIDSPEVGGDGKTRGGGRGEV